MQELMRRDALARNQRGDTCCRASRCRRGWGEVVGGTAALAFAVALLASGASSSSVGTYAGQVVMAGFINFRIPLMLGRALTMLPGIAVIAAGVSPPVRWF